MPTVSYGKLIRLQLAFDHWLSRLARAAAQVQNLRRQIRYQEAKIENRKAFLEKHPQ